MGFGLFKKIKEAIKKAAGWVRDRVIKPVVRTVEKIVKSPTTRKIIDAGVKLAPAIGGAIGASKGQPQAGVAIGSTVQSVGNALGYGR